MVTVSNDLIYEVLKAVQTRLGNIEDGQREIRSELKSMRMQLQAVQVDIGNVYETLAGLDNRMTRIERRLDLAETAAQ
jgi:chromosome segregation ATPase